MNLQLHHVIDDLTGATGSAIIEAILAGERDPLALAKLRNPNIKASTETVAKSLHGHWREEHLLVLRLAWETHAHYRMQITTLKSTVAPSSSKKSPGPPMTSRRQLQRESLFLHPRSPHLKSEKGANPKTNRS